MMDFHTIDLESEIMRNGYDLLKEFEPVLYQKFLKDDTITFEDKDLLIDTLHAKINLLQAVIHLIDG